LLLELLKQISSFADLSRKVNKILVQIDFKKVYNVRVLYSHHDFDFSLQVLKLYMAKRISEDTFECKALAFIVLFGNEPNYSITSLAYFLPDMVDLRYIIV